MQGKYFIGTDQSGHCYLVPADRREEWSAWTNLSEDDEASWEAPSYARRLNGHESNLEFAEPDDSNWSEWLR